MIVSRPMAAKGLLKLWIPGPRGLRHYVKGCVSVEDYELRVEDYILKYPKFKRLLDNSGLDIGSVIMMIKNAK